MENEERSTCWYPSSTSYFWIYGYNIAPTHITSRPSTVLPMSISEYVSSIVLAYYTNLLFLINGYISMYIVNHLFHTPLDNLAPLKSIAIGILSAFYLTHKNYKNTSTDTSTATMYYRTVLWYNLFSMQ